MTHQPLEDPQLDTSKLKAELWKEIGRLSEEKRALETKINVLVQAANTL